MIFPSTATSLQCAPLAQASGVREGLRREANISVDGLQIYRAPCICTNCMAQGFASQFAVSHTAPLANRVAVDLFKKQVERAPPLREVGKHTCEACTEKARIMNSIIALSRPVDAPNVGRRSDTEPEIHVVRLRAVGAV